MNNITVGKRIASLRKDRGFTGEKLANMIHVTPQAISKWENEKNLPETAILPLLAQALGCRIDDLFADFARIKISSFEDIVTIEIQEAKKILAQFDPIMIVKAAMGASPDMNRYLKEVFPDIDFVQEKIRIGSVRIKEIEEINEEIVGYVNKNRIVAAV